MGPHMSTEEAMARSLIRDTLARYNIAGDSKDTAGFVDVFTEDAIFSSANFHFEGKAAIDAFVKKWFFAVPKQPRPTAKFIRHNLTTTQIDFTGPNTANGLVYYYVLSDIGPDHSGHYVDKYRKEQGRWLICQREALVEWCNPASVFVPEKTKRRLIESNPDGQAFKALGKMTGDA